jgi:hypothetical protein
MKEGSSKKYCTWCGERVRHTAYRCPYCGSFVITWQLIVICIVIAVVVVTALFLWLDYQNIEFFH